MNLPPVRRTARFEHVFVGRVPRGTTEQQLRAAFARVGAEVGSIELVLDRVTGLPRGFAFVSLRPRYGSSTDALELGVLRQATLGGRPLDIQSVPPANRAAAAPRGERPSRSCHAGERLESSEHGGLNDLEVIVVKGERS